MQDNSIHCKRLIVLTLSLALCGVACGAEPSGQPESGPVVGEINKVCPLMEFAARANGLPIEFFVRLIWQESHFRADEVGPVTASGERAQGIAQFMPGTAAEHDLAEPFDPSEALPKSGAFLAQLRDEFGNLGLAAAAYNAGPQRLRDYLAGTKSLPAETRNYVFAITGRPVEEWANPAAVSPGPGSAAVGPDAASPTCRDVVALLDRAPDGLASHWERVRLNVPSWCSGLRHPNVSKCGNVHLRVPAITSELRLTSASQAQLSRSHINLRGSLFRRRPEE